MKKAKLKRLRKAKIKKLIYASSVLIVPLIGFGIIYLAYTLTH